MNFLGIDLMDFVVITYLITNIAALLDIMLTMRRFKKWK